MKKRNSSIELLKIIALILITICHCMPVYGDKLSYYCIQLGHSTNDLEILVLTILRSLGELGNIIFIICSSWFLLDSNSLNKEKIKKIIISCFIVSSIFIIISFLFKIPISILELIKSLFTISGGYCWFITCYLLLYLCHPFINQIIQKLDFKNYLRIFLIIFIIYSVIQFPFRNFYYFTQLMGFISIYIFTGFFKKFISMNYYKEIKNIGIISIITNYILMIIINFLGLKISFLNDKVLTIFNYLTNPFYLFFSFYLFYSFYKRNYYSDFINKVSSLSLIYYLLHENYLFRHFMKPLFYKSLFMKINMWYCIVLEILIIFIMGLFLANFIQILVKFLMPFFDFFIEKIEKLYLKLENKVLLLLTLKN